jgi:hypothetical protein
MYAWIMKLREGKVIDGTAFHDSISFNHLWTRVQIWGEVRGLSSLSSWEPRTPTVFRRPLRDPGLRL